MNVYNIPLNCSIIKTIVSLVLKETSNNPLEIANYLIITPNNRSKNLLANEFYNQLKTQSLILPKMIAISDLEELLLSNYNFYDNLNINIIEIISKSAINTNHRALILSKLIKAKNPNLKIHKALNLAYDLGILLDNFITENINLDQIKETAFSSSYQDDLINFLDFSLKSWQNILKELDYVDVFYKRSLILNTQAKIWNNNKSSLQKVLIFGINSYFAALLNVLKSIANLPNGKVILSGLNTNLSDEEFNNLQFFHPQYKNMKILKGINLTKEQVKTLPDNILYTKSSNDIEDLIFGAFNPFPKKFNKNLENSINNIKHITLKTNNDEAKFIALLIRKHFESSDDTVGIVTTNNNLATKITYNLSRWNILSDNSYGTELTKTNVGIFFTIISQITLNNLNYIDLLSLLKHPLCINILENTTTFINTTLLLDLHLLRVSIANKTLNNLINLNKSLFLKEKINTEEFNALNELLLNINNIFSEFSNYISKNKFNFKEALILHIKLVETLTTKNNIHLIWQEKAGKELSNTLKDILSYCSIIGDVSLTEYNSILFGLLKKIKVREHINKDTKVFIYGPMQAEFVEHNLLILADLNENSFPEIPNTSTWLNHSILNKLNLNSPLNTIGELASIFSRLMCNNNVVLTRSEKTNGSLNTPSRFFTKFINTLKANSIVINNESLIEIEKLIPLLNKTKISSKEEDTNTNNDLKTNLAIKHNLAPNPSVALRPKKISATKLEKLLHNPYIFFVNNILKLEPLKTINPPLDASVYGNIVHSILEKFLFKNPIQNLKVTNSEILINNLIKIAEEDFKNLLDYPEVKLFWFNRFVNTAIHFVNKIKNRINSINYYSLEQKSSIALNNIVITGITDRIDYLNNNFATIIDYKTGSYTTYNKKSIKDYRKQLIILGYMLQNSAFNSSYNKVDNLEYWFLPQHIEQDIKIISIKELVSSNCLNEYINLEIIELTKLLNNYLNTEIPFILNKKDANLQKEIKHFARINNIKTNNY